MTVCIGAICERGRAVIVATDRMWTSHDLSIQYEYPEPKIEELSSKCVAAIAGSVVLPTEAIERVKEKVQREGIQNISDIAYALKDEYSKERIKRVNDEIFAPRGITIYDFYRGGLQQRLDSGLVQMLDSEVIRYAFDLVILVGGIDVRGGHLYVIFPPGRIEPFDRVGYAAIGTGQPHAFYTFILESYTPSLPLEEALYLVYKAKKVAERAPGVGMYTDMVVITEKGIRFLTDELMDKLQKTYEREMSIVVNRSEVIKNLKESVSKLKKEVGLAHDPSLSL